MTVREHKRVLVLNADYTPLGLVSWKRAVTLNALYGEDPHKGVFVVDFYKNDYIQGANGKKYPVPAVVASATYVPPKKRIPFSRKNVYIRDQMTCQYCGEFFADLTQLTYDHVIPRSIWKKEGYTGTPTKFDNIVTACRACNHKKADRTPKEAGMKLLTNPCAPRNTTMFIPGLTPWTHVEDEWIPYLTPVYKHLLDQRAEKGV